MSLTALAFLLLAASPADTQDKPNLITIVTDDQALWSVGLYGNKEVQTPNIDRIGREGLVFTNAFVATPVCSPSRATYLTGRWPSELGITDAILAPDERAGIGLVGLTWPAVLQRAGYHTGLIGKWHLGSSPRYHPTNLGYHEFFGFLAGATAPVDALLERNGRDVQTKGYLEDILTDEAIGFIEKHRERPFALSLHFRAPHRPFTPVPDEDARRYRELDPTVPDLPGLDTASLKNETRDYYASVSSIDRNIGRLLEALDRLDLSRNTVVLFTSDHGFNLGRHYIDTKGNGRWIAGGVPGPIRPNMWDTSIRVPLVVRWPDVIEPGRRAEQMVSNIDMFRTVLAALGVPLPQEAEPHGVDFSPILFGRPCTTRDALFGQYDMYQASIAHLRMIRTQRYKFVRHYGTNFLDELYDVEDDPEEHHNLVRRPSHADLVRELQEQLTEWQRSIKDPQTPGARR